MPVVARDGSRRNSANACREATSSPSTSPPRCWRRRGAGLPLSVSGPSSCSPILPGPYRCRAWMRSSRQRPSTGSLTTTPFSGTSPPFFALERPSSPNAVASAILSESMPRRGQPASILILPTSRPPPIQNGGFGPPISSLCAAGCSHSQPSSPQASRSRPTCAPSAFADTLICDSPACAKKCQRLKRLTMPARLGMQFALCQVSARLDLTSGCNRKGGGMLRNIWHHLADASHLPKISGQSKYGPLSVLALRRFHYRCWRRGWHARAIACQVEAHR